LRQLAFSRPRKEDVDELIYPEWQAEFQAAIIETDLHALRIRIAAAEALMRKRLREIAVGPDHDLERMAIADAFAALRVLKRET
jgi:hypothetical protein